MRVFTGLAVVVLCLSFHGSSHADSLPSIAKWLKMSQAERLAVSGAYRRRTCPKLGEPTAEQKANAWKIMFSTDPRQVTDYIDGECRALSASAR